MTQAQGKQLVILAAQADRLADLRERKRISDAEYFARLNVLRCQAGLEPLQYKREDAPRLETIPAWSR